MKTALALITLLCGAFSAISATVTLGWTASPTPNISGYRIYWGTNSYPALGGSMGFIGTGTKGTSFTVSNSPAGIMRFQATAYMLDGTESSPSNELLVTNSYPGPTNLRLISTTNESVMLEIQSPPRNTRVDWSPDATNWQGYASIQSLESNAPINRTLFVDAVKPGAKFYRFVSVPSAGPSPAPLPQGISLKAGSPAATKP